MAGGGRWATVTERRESEGEKEEEGRFESFGEKMKEK